MKKVIASTLIALTAFTAVPAKAADSSDVVAGIIFGLILGQHAERQQQQQPVYRDAPVVVMPQHNPRNERGRPSYTRGYDNPHLVCEQQVVRGHGHTEVISRNCYGEIISVTRTPRY